MIGALGIADGPAFLRLMKRYVVDYTNSHDQAQTATIMEPDYVLCMGEHRVVGRDGAYAAATRRQMDQFPGLGLTVHEIWTSGERLAMRFSEHGASGRHAGAQAAWGGIGLYRWNGARLTANNVEQDYASRARQLKSGIPLDVEAPAIAPWDGVGAEPDAAAEEVVRRWLDAGALETAHGVLCDDAWAGVTTPRLIDQDGITVDDLFSCGDAVAFHASQRGTLTADAFDGIAPGRAVTLHMAGIVHVRQGSVTHGRVIRNRLDVQRDLMPREGRAA